MVSWSVLAMVWLILGNIKKGPFLICNPLTGESILIPYFNYSGLDRKVSSIGRFSSLASGFGYCPSTKKYKVIMIHYSDQMVAHKGRVQVYTVGGEWRHIGFIDRYEFKSSGIHVNGALYWLHKNDYKLQECEIVAFDLEAGKFHSIPVPPYEHFEDYERSRFCPIKLLGGTNNYYFAYTSTNSRTDIWVYKRNNINSGGSSYTTKEQCKLKPSDHKESSSCWIKEFSIEHKADNLYYEFEPFAVTRNNEVLMWYNRHIPFRTRLCCYDPKTLTLNKLWDDNAKGMVYVEAIPHTHSLVSLKELGETGVSYLKDLEKHVLIDLVDVDLMLQGDTQIPTAED
ncbi:uncharacterized protein LOC113324094 [Papaver somniferum]|uniref:uncharacterized protein LOC113324089 n=1 Tax=Papaver somniferum TaxID=3469 RepID=UPI000E70229E|nr:uncharacterized protein LOC113324089 [Papaver somniferum]XP_026428215.1 uncharacterized protein LOC113324094 [Papaver somniferum]